MSEVPEFSIVIPNCKFATKLISSDKVCRDESCCRRIIALNKSARAAELRLRPGTALLERRLPSGCGCRVGGAPDDSTAGAGATSGGGSPRRRRFLRVPAKRARASTTLPARRSGGWDRPGGGHRLPEAPAPPTSTRRWRWRSSRFRRLRSLLMTI